MICSPLKCDQRRFLLINMCSPLHIQSSHPETGWRLPDLTLGAPLFCPAPVSSAMTTDGLRLRCSLKIRIEARTLPAARGRHAAGLVSIAWAVGVALFGGVVATCAPFYQPESRLRGTLSALFLTHVGVGAGRVPDSARAGGHVCCRPAAGGGLV
jgi:hypothetical protein